MISIYPYESPKPHAVEIFWKRGFDLTVGMVSKLTVTKTEVFGNVLQTRGIWNLSND